MKALIFEKSATLRHVLSRQLQAAGVDEVVCRTDIDALAADLAEADGEPADALIVGWPSNSDEALQQLLSKTGKREQWRDRIVVLTHDEREGKRLRQALPKSVHGLGWAEFRAVNTLVSQWADQPRESTQQATADTGSHADNQALRVLLLDDSSTVRQHFGRVLKGEGYELLSASNLAEARKQLAGNPPVDVAILDYFLPDGTGAELCREISEQHRFRHTQVAILTGTYDENIISRCLHAGAFECMFKDEGQRLFLARVAAMARSVQRQRAAASERERLEGILAAVGDGVFGVDDSGRITFANPATLQLLDYQAESQLVGMQADEALHQASGEDDVDMLALAYQDGRVLNGFETEFINQDGLSLPVECTVLPMSRGGERLGSVVVFRDISARKSLERVRWEARHDALTGLANYRSFRREAGDALGRLRASGKHGAWLYLNLDHFEWFNDAFGRSAGDRLLVDVAARLGERVRDGDLVCRLKDDQFLILLPRARPETVLQMAEGFRREISQCVGGDQERRHQATASVGVVILNADTHSLEHGMDQARMASCIARQRGRNRVHLFVAERDRALAEELSSGWGERLQQALQRRDLALATSALMHREDLHGERTAMTGVLLADLELRDGRQAAVRSQFLQPASRLGLIGDVDVQALKLAVSWLRDHDRCQLMLRLSAHAMQQESVFEQLLDVLARSRADVMRLVLCIEDPLGRDDANSLDIVPRLTRLRDSGVRLVLDDVGGERSSFASLRALPLDGVMVSTMLERGRANAGDQHLLAAIVDMAHGLDLDVYADGVDDAELLALCDRLAIDFVGGAALSESSSDNTGVDSLADAQPLQA